MNVIDQVVTEKYALYNGDCIDVMKDIPDESIGLSVYSPPFCNLYSYSDSNKDMGNSNGKDEFFSHYRFLIHEHMRTMMPGRIVAVHCMDLPTHKKDGEEIGLYDFPGDIIQEFISAGFVFHARFVIWKDPLLAATRTKAIGLAHKQIVKDSSMCRTGIPDYILAFRKPGENPIPIEHKSGFEEYHGQRSIPKELQRYRGTDNQKTNKLSHWIWQQYASPVWFDIRQMNVLPYKEGKEHDDEKHICPLQLDVIERCLALWSVEEDAVLSPFAGIGSEVYCAIQNRRKGIGIELKNSYFKIMKRNAKKATRSQKQKTGLGV